MAVAGEEQVPPPPPESRSSVAAVEVAPVRCWSRQLAHDACWHACLRFLLVMHAEVALMCVVVDMRVPDACAGGRVPWAAGRAADPVRRLHGAPLL
eukprot:3277398-Rhodomonas_salina.1